MTEKEVEINERKLNPKEKEMIRETKRTKTTNLLVNTLSLDFLKVKK